MKKGLLILLFMFTAVVICFAAFEDLPQTAKTRALGGAISPRIEGVESIFYNPAGMFTSEKISITLAYSQPYNISDLNRSVIGINYKFKRYNFGLGINQLSLSDVYTERKIILAASIRLQRLYLGLAFNYYTISISGLDYDYMPPVIVIGGSPGALDSQVSIKSFSIGALYRLRENLNLSLAVYDSGNNYFMHLNQEYYLGTTFETKLPGTISIGAFYSFKDYVFISTELKNTPEEFDNLEESLRLGLEFLFYKSFAMCLGNYSGDTTYGFGIITKNFNLDFAFISNPNLGNNYMYSLQIKF
ncbi:hypothetical protein KAU33_04710 [Candidatus Dependentiae bacterium]|nr:hypothetical protein [Candidatus Dependentiae bacterium]